MIQTAQLFSRRVLLSRRRLMVVTSSRATFATTNNDKSNEMEWRKHQLDKLSRKFQPPNEIQKDEELQPMWKDMESRVTRRRPLTLQEAKGKTGRRNIRKTDEEAWLQAGLYSSDDDENHENDENNDDEEKEDSTKE